MKSYVLGTRRRSAFSFFSGTSLTLKLILLNVGIYFVSLVLFQIYGESFIRNFALVPSLILSGKNLWALFTSMFLHDLGSPFHLFANMFSLFFVGSFLERIVGRKRFFWLYLFSGILGGIFYVGGSLIFGGTNVPAVGASGAIFGLLGVLAVLVPHSKLYLIVGPLILLVVEVLVDTFLPSGFSTLVGIIFNLLFFVMILSLFSLNSSFRKFALPLKIEMWLLPIVAIVPLAIIGFFIDLPIGNSAHLGGLVAGLIYGFYLRHKFPNKTRNLSRRFGR